MERGRTGDGDVVGRISEEIGETPDHRLRKMTFGDQRDTGHDLPAAYKVGPGGVARLGRIPDIPETQTYVVSVVDCYLALTAGQPVTSASQCQTRSVGP